MTSVQTDEKVAYATQRFDLSRPLPMKEVIQAQNEAITPQATQAQDPAPAATPKLDPEDDNTWKQRYADLRSLKDKEANTYTSTLQQWMDAAAEKDRKIAELQTVKKTLPLTEEEFNDIATSYPNIDKMVHVRAQKLLDEELAPLRAELDALRGQTKQEQEAKAKEQLRKMHPDFDSLAENPVFREWYAKQPKSLQGIITNSNDVYEIARVLDIYKNEVGAKSIKREKDLEASAGVKVDAATQTGSGKPEIFKLSEVKAKIKILRGNALAEYMAVINKATAEGRIDTTT